MARILVVDDESAVRKLARKLLESSGHTVDEAQDGECALRIFESCPHDLVVTDILMPSRGGLALIKDVRERNPDQKILAISGGGRDGRQNFLSTAKLFEGVRTMSKPFALLEFTKTVEEMLK